MNSTKTIKLSGEGWTKLLVKYPHFAARCEWLKLNGDDWVQLLRVQPQFSNRCDWSKFNGRCWAELLAIYPEFADRCNLAKLAHYEKTSISLEKWVKFGLPIAMTLIFLGGHVALWIKWFGNS